MFEKDPKGKVKDNKVPGPGEYKIPEKMGREGAKYTLISRQPEKPIVRSPGPAKYDFKFHTARKSEGFSFGSEKRTQDDSKIAPGPGNYELLPKDKKQGGFSFNRDKKNKIEKNENPGPGNYHIKCSFADVPYFELPASKKDFKYI